MKELKINSVFKLRRDNDYNYDKVKDKWIPADGELFLVDTARNGLRAKVGDGKSTYGQLPFADEGLALNIIIQGYFYENEFYYDEAHNEKIEPSNGKIYIDILTRKSYVYSDSYIALSKDVEMATKDVAGISKLYDELGENTDGSINQKVITEELDEKVEMRVIDTEETLMLSTDLF